VELTLEEGQIAIIGCRPDKVRSFGSFLFSQPAAENDERHQRLILIWASRNMNGIVAEAPKGADRSRLFRRLGGTPDEPPASPAPPPPPIPGAPAPTPRTPSARPGAARSADAPVKAKAKPPAPDAATSPSPGPPPDTQSAPPLPSQSKGQ